jgi:hypothetical protein
MKSAAVAIKKSKGHPPGYRLAVLSRVAAAVVGGYALAAILPILLSRVLPLPKAEAVLTAVLLSFVVYTCAILWVFAVRTAGRAWSGLMVANGVGAALCWMVAP